MSTLVVFHCSGGMYMPVPIALWSNRVSRSWLSAASSARPRSRIFTTARSPVAACVSVESLWQLVAVDQRDHQVRRLDVAVDHVVLVDVLQPARRLANDLARLGNRQRPVLGDQLVEAHALDVLHHQVVHLVGRATTSRSPRRCSCAPAGRPL